MQNGGREASRGMQKERNEGFRSRRSEKKKKMLTGKESLMRLIGKRKRTLSAKTSSLFGFDQSKSCSPLISKEEENDSYSSSVLEKECSSNKESGISKEQRQQGQEDQKLEWVTCPVCGSVVRGEDYTLNTHLDACLSGGKKRKLSQRTLLHFSFSSRPKGNSLSGPDAIEDDGKNSLGHIAIAMPSMVAFHERKETNECLSESASFWFPNPESCSVDSNKNINSEFVTNCEEVNAVTPKLLLEAKLPTFNMSGIEAGIIMKTLQTHVVGCKFHGAVDIAQGDSIFLSREPDNLKDPNAIKVLLTDSVSGQMLGFLPRELAKYLAPLVDKYCLQFKGSVMSTPRNPHDVIPIQFSCEEMTPQNKMEADDRQMFEFLWNNAIRAVEVENAFPVSMTKHQRNFHILMLEVLKQYNHLFTDDEKSFLGSFVSLSDDGQRLFLRLYTRKGPWFCLNDISYPEISDSQQAVEQLCAINYLRSLGATKEPSITDIREVLDALTVPELREISNSVLSKKGISHARKRELVDSLFTSYEDGKCPSLPNIVVEQYGTFIRISSTAEILCWRLERLFFLSGEQDLKSFLLVDLGLVKYPAYTCNISRHIFMSRSRFLAYEEAIEVAQIMDESLDENNLAMVMRCIQASDERMSTTENASHLSIPESVVSFHLRFTASWVYSKVVTLGVSFFERHHRYAEAVRLLKCLLETFKCDSRRGYWTLRLSVDLEHINHINESLSLAEQGVQDPWIRAGSKMALQRRVIRLGKPPRRWKIPSFAASVNQKIKEVHVLGRPLNCEQGMKNRYYGDDEGQCSVEQLALQYYAGEGGGWQGVHTESGIWMTIFGLLMWNIIFADIPDVFLTRFQLAPLDFDTDSFYISRKSLIEGHLQKIHEGMAEEIIIASWESHKGTACLGVNWDQHCLSDLRAAVVCVGGPCLASLCRHLAEDYRNWSSGLPDLLLWRFSGEYRGEAKLVEVKGPRDRLSEQQRAWLLTLMDCGFNVEVCKVSPTPLHKA